MNKYFLRKTLMSRCYNLIIDYREKMVPKKLLRNVFFHKILTNF